MLNKSKNDQIELGLKAPAAKPGKPSRTRTARDSQWWFRQMRQVVNMAVEWQPTPMATPQQAHLQLTTSSLGR